MDFRGLPHRDDGQYTGPCSSFGHCTAMTDGNSASSSVRGHAHQGTYSEFESTLHGRDRVAETKSKSSEERKKRGGVGDGEWAWERSSSSVAIFRAQQKNIEGCLKTSFGCRPVAFCGVQVLKLESTSGGGKESNAAGGVEGGRGGGGATGGGGSGSNLSMNQTLEGHEGSVVSTNYGERIGKSSLELLTLQVVMCRCDITWAS